MASAKTEVDSRKFMEAMTGLQRNLRIPMRTVIKTEVGSILKQCAGDTKVQNQDWADRRARVREAANAGYTRNKTRGSVTVNTGWKKSRPVGRVWLNVGNRKFILARGENFSDPTGSAPFKGIGGARTQVWVSRVDAAVSEMKSAWKKAIPAARKALGLARQSWVQIADAAGIQLELVPGGRISAAGLAKARSALASDGNPYLNGQARAFQDNKSFVLELTNSLPYGRKAGLDRVLVRAINGRAAFFAKNVKLGVFNSVSKILAAYPGFKVSV